MRKRYKTSIGSISIEEIMAYALLSSLDIIATFRFRSFFRPQLLRPIRLFTSFYQAFFRGSKFALFLCVYPMV
jgi:hypothetical protein